jgi:hypothetical protein
MVNLIIALIGIALVAVTAVIALYSGGDVFNSGSSKAEFARLTKEASEIQAGSILFEQYEGRRVGSIQELVDRDYLKSYPSGFNAIDNQAGTVWFAYDSYVATSIDDEKMALEISKHAGADEIPTCYDSNSNLRESVRDGRTPVCIAD